MGCSPRHYWHARASASEGVFPREAALQGDRVARPRSYLTCQFYHPAAEDCRRLFAKDGQISVELRASTEV